VYIQLVSEDPAHNRQRLYQLCWQPDLWGSGALVRTWGRRGQPGVSRVSRYPDRPAAQAQISRLLRRRLQHGYTVVAWQ
jgi:predicted DNA-binding WGR domain protein